MAFYFSTISLQHIKSIPIPSTRADNGITMSPWYANGTMDISFNWNHYQSQKVFEETWLSSSDSSILTYALGSTGYYTPKIASNTNSPNHFRIQRPARHRNI